jgi:DDB1- and CUL4-associated factor 1
MPLWNVNGGAWEETSLQMPRCSQHMLLACLPWLCAGTFFSLFNSLLEEIVIVYRHYYYSDDDSHLILATLPPPPPPLVSGGSLVEGVLAMGVSAMLMRFLRMRVLGDASFSQKGADRPIDAKHSRARDDSRGQPHGERRTDDAYTSLDIDIPETDICDTRSKHCENADLLKRKQSRAGPRVRAKGKAGESLPECEIVPSSLTSGLRIGGRATRDSNASRIEEPKTATGTSDTSAGLSLDTISREEYEDRFWDCIIGLKDISGIVLKAVRAAEAEARSANAPDEAVKAAGDAAAELVKSSALEVSHTHTKTQ